MGVFSLPTYQPTAKIALIGMRMFFNTTAKHRFTGLCTVDLDFCAILAVFRRNVGTAIRVVFYSVGIPYILNSNDCGAVCFNFLLSNRFCSKTGFLFGIDLCQFSDFSLCRRFCFFKGYSVQILDTSSYLIIYSVGRIGHCQFHRFRIFREACCQLIAVHIKVVVICTQRISCRYIGNFVRNIVAATVLFLEHNGFRSFCDRTIFIYEVKGYRKLSCRYDFNIIKSSDEN